MNQGAEMDCMRTVSGPLILKIVIYVHCCRARIAFPLVVGLLNIFRGAIQENPNSEQLATLCTISVSPARLAFTRRGRVG